MDDASKLKERLIKHISGGEAFMPIDEMLKIITFDKLGERPNNLPYSFYELFNHIRFTQKDILEYCTLSAYKAPKWPDDYWPHQKVPTSILAWGDLKNSYFEERTMFIKHIENNDLLKRMNKETDHTLMREVLLVIEHTAYHSGQLLIILRQLGLYNT